MKRILLLSACYVIINSNASAQNNSQHTAGSIHSESASQAKMSIKKTLVRLYPNPSYGKLSISVNTTAILHFYIFDLEGTLVYQAILKNKDRKSIDNLKKGTYLYDVFEKDQSVENGKIIIK